jgi:hypothetical protein
MYAKPMIAHRGGIPEQQRRAVIDGNQDVDGTVVIEISDSKPAGIHLSREDRSASCAYVRETLLKSAEEGSTVLRKSPRHARS